MKIRDYIFFTWLFGGNRRARMVGGPEGGHLCNACRTPVDPEAKICRACGSDLYTIKGKLVRGVTALAALVLMLFGASPDISIIYVGIGFVVLAVCGYFQFSRPVH